MEIEKRRQVIKEINEPLFIFGAAPITIGFLLFCTSSVSAPGIIVLQHSGMGLVFFGWCVAWVEELVNRNKSTTKSIAMIAMGIFGMVAYIYLY